MPNVILQKPFIDFEDAQITKSSTSECKKKNFSNKIFLVFSFNLALSSGFLLVPLTSRDSFSGSTVGTLYFHVALLIVDVFSYLMALRCCCFPHGNGVDVTCEYLDQVS